MISHCNFFLYFVTNLFVCFWLHWVFLVEYLSSCGEHGLLIEVASLAVELGVQGSVVVVRGLSGPTACGIFPDHGWNLCPLYWQEDS